MNVDCRWLGTFVRRVRIPAAGLALLAAGCMMLGRSSRTGEVVANVPGGVPKIAAAEFMPARLTQVGLTQAGLTQKETPAEAKSRAKSQARSLFAGLPLMFEPNVGQANLDAGDSQAKFVARGPGYGLLLGSEGATLSLSRRAPGKPKAIRVDSLRMKLAGANQNAAITAAEALPGKSNYLLGNDSSKWRTGVPQFARVRYENVYPGVNLVFYGNQRQLEYDFQVAPGADPKQAELEFDGAKRLELKDGALVIRVAGGSVQLEAPTVYQEIAGRREPVEGSFVLRGEHRAGFAIGNYDHSRELVIDPVLTFSTYFGGSGNELNNSVAVDQSFNVYLAGSTDSTNLPGIVNGVSFQSTLNSTPPATNVYIAKITPPQGSNVAILDFVTYLGGNGPDTPVGIGVDGAGNPYVAGTTSSTNFPVSATNPYQSSPTLGSPGPHVFVTRMNATGSALVYSSYLSGSGTDMASGMTTDSQGFIYVTGSTTSTQSSDTANGVQWPVISLPNGQPFQSTSKAGPGVAQFFVTKVNTNSAGSASITYSTYFGGGTSATTPPIVNGGGIAVDENGNIYFSGTTNFYFLGQTSSSLTDFPILNPYQPCLNVPAPAVIQNPPTCTADTTGFSDSFVAKLNPNAPAGTGQLGWSTYVGGSGTDSSTGVGVDTGAANVYITGTTDSIDIGESQVTSTTSAAFQRCLDTPTNPLAGAACPTLTGTAPYPTDAFVAKFPNLTASTTTFSNLQLVYFSYLGGSLNDAGLAIAVDNAAGAVLTGWTQSTDFPFPSGSNSNIQGTYGGDQDAFIARLNTAATTQNTQGSWTTYYGGSGVDEGTNVTLDVNQNIYVAGDTTSTSATLQMKEPLSVDTNNNGGSDAFLVELGNASTVTLTGILKIANNQTYISAGNQATFIYTVTNGGPDPAYNLSIIDNLNETGLVSISLFSASATDGTCSGGTTTTSVVCTIPSLQAGETSTVTIVLIPLADTGTNGGAGSRVFTGGTVQVVSSSNILLATTSVQGNMADYAISISPSNQSVVAGNTAPYQIQLTPDPIYTSSVSLACTGEPAASSCNFTNSPVTLPGSGVGSSTLNITTTVRPIVTPASLQMPRQFYALWLMVPGLALIGLGSSDRRRRRIAGLLMMCTIFSMLVLLPACSHSTVQPPTSGTPPGIYQITVTATSGTDTKSQSIQLTVD